MTIDLLPQAHVSPLCFALPSPSFFFHGEEDLRKGIDTERKILSASPPLGGSLGEASSAQPLWGSGTGVMALTGVPPLDASLSHSF
jgi:hypothetical protein